MAIRFDAAADELNLVGSLPSNTSFTIMVDCQVVADVGALDGQPIVWALNGSLTEGYSFLWEGAVGAVVVTYDGGAVSTSAAHASRPDIGSAFCAYIKCSGNGTNQIEAGWRYPNGAWVTAATTLAATIEQVTTLYLGGIFSTYWCNKRLQNLRIWDRPLSGAELMAESCSATPISTVGLHSYFPVQFHNDIFDRGPKGRTLTRAGTLTTEYFSYPRPRIARRIPVPYEPPAATAFQNLVGRPFSLAGVHGLAGD